MASRPTSALLFLLPFLHGCSHSSARQTTIRTTGYPRPPPQVLAVYEAWFGHPKHISVGYSSHDPDVIRKQIRQAKALGISGFVVDWYGYRQPFIDRSYALMQSIAAEENFRVAMMYDETADEEGATDESIEDFKLFRKTYLAANAPGRQAYLMFNGRPVIFIFPKQHTDWSRVRAEINKWTPPPLLINEFPPENLSHLWMATTPGSVRSAGNSSNWGSQYLTNFYNTMQSKYPDAIAVGGAWASFR